MILLQLLTSVVVANFGVSQFLWRAISLCVQGLRLELCTGDRVGLLSDMTRIFSENGLSVTRADVSTQGDKAINVFYVTDPSGDPVDKTVERIRRNYPILGVKEMSSISGSPQVSASSKGLQQAGRCLQWHKILIMSVLAFSSKSSSDMDWIIPAKMRNLD
jgi:hypothetical protein